MNLKQYQQKHKFTDQQMADNCGISKEGYIKVRNDKSRKTTIDTIDKIEKGTNLKWKEFINKK